MATYNGQKYINQQIDSILYQLNEDDELIISDDGSSDKTIDIIKSYNDKRIKLLFHQRNLKTNNNTNNNFYFVTNNFENALYNAKGEFIFLSDQDDIWELNKIKVMSEYLTKFDIVICNLSVIDKNNIVTSSKFYNYKNKFVTNCIINLFKSHYIGCCMAFNKKILKFSLPFPQNLLVHDLWIGTIGFLFGKSVFIDTPLHKYRRHENNNSTSTSQSQNNFIFRLHYRIVFISQILKRLFDLNFNRSMQIL